MGAEVKVAVGVTTKGTPLEAVVATAQIPAKTEMVGTNIAQLRKCLPWQLMLSTFPRLCNIKRIERKLHYFLPGPKITSNFSVWSYQMDTRRENYQD